MIFRLEREVTLEMKEDLDHSLFTSYEGKERQGIKEEGKEREGRDLENFSHTYS